MVHTRYSNGELRYKRAGHITIFKSEFALYNLSVLENSNTLDFWLPNGIPFNEL